MKAQSQRQLRAGELIRHALADIFMRGELNDDSLEQSLITVPEVRMSPDLKIATVFVAKLGGSDDAHLAQELNRHRKFLRGRVSGRISLKYAPELKFRADTRFDETQKIDALLNSPDVRRDTGMNDD